MTYRDSDRKPYIGIYGNTKILKGYCTACEGYAFVIKGELQCCDAPFTDTPSRYKREIEAEPRRRLPPLSERRARLLAQNNRCFYCERAFYSLVGRGSRLVSLRIAWDHLVPYAYSQDNRTVNFVAACHVCNGLKGSLLFDTVAEAQIYLQSRREAKGYS